MGFADELWDSFDVVYKKVNEGKAFSDEVSILFKKIAEIERDYSKRLSAAIKSSTVPETESGTVMEAWQVIKRETEAAAKKHNDYADALVASVSEPIAAWNKENMKQRRKLKVEGSKLVKDMIAGEQKVNKAKQAYEVAKRALEVTERSLKKDPKKLAVDSKRAEGADASYHEAVDAQKELEIKFYDTEMPKILTELELLETSRRTTMKTGFTKYVELQVKLPVDTAQIQALQTAVANIDPAGDIRRFIGEAQTRKERPQRTEYEPYNPAIKACAPAHTIQSQAAGSVAPAPSTYDYQPAIAQPSSYGSPGSGASVYGGVASPATSPPSYSSNASSRAMARALYDYTATGARELSFKTGDIITILVKDASGWWHGELNGVQGLLPSNFLEEVTVPARPPPPSSPSGSSMMANPTPSSGSRAGAGIATPFATAATLQPTTTAAPGGFNPSAQSAVAPVASVASVPQQQCRVLYNYDAENEYELTIRPGEVLYIIQLDDDGWYRGTNAAGQFGRFPSNFVEPL